MRKVTTTESEIVQFRQDVQTKLRQRVREAIETVLDEGSPQRWAARPTSAARADAATATGRSNAR